jgi:hypothetical protein
MAQSSFESIALPPNPFGRLWELETTPTVGVESRSIPPERGVSGGGEEDNVEIDSRVESAPVA